MIYRLMAALTLSFAALSCATEIPAEEEDFIEVSTDEGEDTIIEGNPYWDWVDKYPGGVSSLLDREDDVEVTVKGGYDPIAYVPDTTVLQSTGLYAAAGEYITIEVPAGTAGLQWQIGLGYELLPGQLQQRYKNIVRRGLLHPGKNRVMNHFGGFIYLGYEPDKVPAGDITVTISGGIPTNDFILGETKPLEWLETMQLRSQLYRNPIENEDSMAFLPWVELRSDKIILTCGVKELEFCPNPEDLLNAFAPLVDSYYAFNALDNTNQMPMRIYTDIQMPDADQTPLFAAMNVLRYGRYPMVRRRREELDQWGREKDMLYIPYIRGERDANGVAWMEYLLTFADATLNPWQGEPNSDSYMKTYWPSLKMSQYYYVARINSVHGDPTNFTSWVDKINTPVTGVDLYKSCLDNTQMYLKIGELGRTAPLMQLALEYGWGLFPYLSERSNELGYQYIREPYLDSQSAYDFFAMTCCEYADRNLLPFFKMWYFPLTQIATDYMKNFQELSDDEIFWTSFDTDRQPSFELKVPNKSFARPSWNIQFEEVDQDVKRNWALLGNLYNGTYYPGRLIRSRTSNSVVDPEWKKAWDGNNATSSIWLGNCYNTSNVSSTNIPIYEMSFVGPDDSYRAVDDEDVYATDSLVFNTLMFWNDHLFYWTNYIYDIEYEDCETGEWKSTKPDSFRLYHSEKMDYYFFEETYATKHIRFKLRPVSPGTSNYARCQIQEISFGLVSTVPAPAPEP
ncbi:MAG: hypothetical protein IJS07_04420 [Bacteroidales bacterium]|nr:hypothetical protein [Bacteroidales bacterium]